jgi:hypothetical protein
MALKCVDNILVAEDRIWWRSVFNMVMKFRIKEDAPNFLVGWVKYQILKIFAVCI